MLFLLAWVGLSPWLHGQALSEAEADRLVAEEVAALEALRVKLPEFTVLGEHRRVQDGRGMIVRKVLPPVFEPAADPIATDAVEEPVSMRAARAYRPLFLGIRVVDGEVSEILWRRDGRTIRAWSNIDFGHLTAMTEIARDETVYLLFAVVRRTTRGLEAARQERLDSLGFGQDQPPIPQLADFSGADPEYLAWSDSEEPIPAAFFEELDALHFHYAAHAAELLEAAQRREALAAARARHDAAHPKPQGPTVIHYWKVEPARTEGGR